MRGYTGELDYACFAFAKSSDRLTYYQADIKRNCIFSTGPPRERRQGFHLMELLSRSSAQRTTFFLG